MRGLEMPKRARKRGSAEPVRCYRHHISMRLTYYEAEMLGALFDTLGMHNTGDRPNPIDQWEDQRDRRALKRVRRKVELAAGADQDAVRRANRVKRLARFRGRVKAAQDAGVKPDYWEESEIRYLEGCLSEEDTDG